MVLKSSQLNSSLSGKMWLTRTSTSPEPKMDAMLPASSGLFRPAQEPAPSAYSALGSPELSTARVRNSFLRLVLYSVQGTCLGSTSCVWHALQGSCSALSEYLSAKQAYRRAAQISLTGKCSAHQCYQCRSHRSVPEPLQARMPARSRVQMVQLRENASTSYTRNSLCDYTAQLAT